MNLDRPYPPNPYDYLPQVASFTLTSQNFCDGKQLPALHANDGGDLSPQLSWSGFPRNTKSFVVTCYDPDAPTPAGYWHWIAVNIPASVTDLAQAAGCSDEALPAGAFHIANDNSLRRYSGPLPPAGDHAHRYFFVVHALDVERLDIDPQTTNATQVSFTTGMHTLGRALIVGTYQR
ncbi:MAG: YbhB/YbcL family Raf kinase inhibitor-like protein [Actinomycetaceae bacterium]|nr:YbhB/YbcL family Raf kinase inhibitor-like protein [Arcanobacterium sp.]MDD7686902.1 YbhB/YbcL family Raf kinase inhibitor-like protein [Actinomycetaceae bacterium]MDY5273446.1 YbhB/YbcL family Raf kinase inhibitor-like protein [Arcanobacterium sp.]